MKHPKTRHLFDYWRSQWDGDRAPLRQKIDPQHFRACLGYTFILQRIDADHHIFRLAGTGLCAHYGREFRDHNFLTLWAGKDRRAMKALVEQAVLSSQAAYATFSAETVDRQLCPFETVLLPLRNAEGRRDRVLGVWQCLVDIRDFRGHRFVNHTLKSVFMLTNDALSVKPVVADSLLSGKAPPYLKLVHSSSEVA
ncbi:MAG: PAS domain-containing protein [Pseudomonadota bacterium]